MTRHDPRTVCLVWLLVSGCSPASFDELEADQAKVPKRPNAATDAEAPVMHADAQIDPRARVPLGLDAASAAPVDTAPSSDAGAAPLAPALPEADAGTAPRRLVGAAITSAGPGARVLEVVDWGTADNAPLHLAPLRPGDGFNEVGNQRWSLRAVEYPSAASVYQIENVFAYGMCLDKSYSAGDIDGAAIYLYRCRANDPDRNQLWRVQPRGNGSYQLVNMRDGRCLEITDGSDGPATVLGAFTCRSDSWSQGWKISGLD